MLASEVKDVNSKTDVVKDGVIFDHFPECAIVVEENMIRHQIFDAVGASNHLLHMTD